MTATRNPAAMTYRVEDGQPWIGMSGTVMAEEGTTNEQMLNNASLLGWNVRLDEVITPAKVDVPSFEVLRDDPADGLPHRLAIVGNRYHEVQNESLIAMADTITSGDARVVAAGQWNNGRRVFVSFELGDSLVLDPNGQADAIGRFLTVQAGHDGSLGISFNTHDMRLRCQNMLTSIRQSKMGSFKMRHTQNVEGRILAARQALGIAFKASDEFAKEMQALMDVQVTDQKFQQIIEKVYPRPEKDVKGSLAKWEHKAGTLTSLWKGDTLANLDNTAYKAYNALNENLMWYGSIRAGNVDGALVKASGLDEATNKENLALYKAVLLATA